MIPHTRRGNKADYRHSYPESVGRGWVLTSAFAQASIHKLYVDGLHLVARLHLSKRKLTHPAA